MSKLKNQKNSQQKSLKSLAKGSSRVLLEVKTVFPFNFFPDEIILDETKVSILVNYFFYSKEVRSIAYGDIFNVVVQQGLFFAKLEIVDKFFAQQPLVVTYLKKKDAILARRLIQGLIIVNKEKIDTGKIPKKELIEQLEKIGKSR